MTSLHLCSFLTVGGCAGSRRSVHHVRRGRRPSLAQLPLPPGAAHLAASVSLCPRSSAWACLDDRLQCLDCKQVVCAYRAKFSAT